MIQAILDNAGMWFIIFLSITAIYYTTKRSSEKEENNVNQTIKKPPSKNIDLYENKTYCKILLAKFIEKEFDPLKIGNSDVKTFDFVDYRYKKLNRDITEEIKAINLAENILKNESSSSSLKNEAKFFLKEFTEVIDDDFGKYEFEITGM